MMDVDLGDMIDYLGQSPGTRSIILYVENVTNPRKFMSAARAFARGKPIVAYKAGRFAASAKATVSHTGAMAGEDSVYDAAFERAGIVRVDRIEDVFATAELLAHERRPTGPRLAIVTNAGGPGVMAADTLLARGGAPGRAGSGHREGARRTRFPASASITNPVDVLGDAPPERLEAAVTALLADREVDAVLVILTPQAMTDPTAAAAAVVAAGRGRRKPLLAAWMGGPSVAEGLRVLEEAGVPAYNYPRGGRGGVHAPRGLRPQPRDAARDAAGAARCPSRSTAAGCKDLMASILSEGDEVLSEAVRKGAARRLRDPGDQAAAGRDRRGCRGGGRADRLPGGAQGPLARRDPQDRRGRGGRGRGHLR